MSDYIYKLCVSYCQTIFINSWSMMKVALPSEYCLLLSLCLLHRNTANRMVQKLLDTWWPLWTVWSLNFPHTNGICVSHCWRETLYYQASSTPTLHKALLTFSHNGWNDRNRIYSTSKTLFSAFSLSQVSLRSLIVSSSSFILVCHSFSCASIILLVSWRVVFSSFT